MGQNWLPCFSLLYSFICIHTKVRSTLTYTIRPAWANKSNFLTCFNLNETFVSTACTHMNFCVHTHMYTNIFLSPHGSYSASFCLTQYKYLQCGTKTKCFQKISFPNCFFWHYVLLPFPQTPQKGHSYLIGGWGCPMEAKR